MIIRRCDRCGKAYTPYRDNGKHKLVPGVNGVAFVHINQKGEYDDGRTDAFDLCPECLDAVYKFILEAIIIDESGMDQANAGIETC